jgi:hypothetical protein
MPYDAAGRIANDGRSVMRYDAEDRMVSTVPVGGGATTGYGYDGEGRRVSAGGVLGRFTSPDEALFDQDQGDLQRWNVYAAAPSLGMQIRRRQALRFFNSLRRQEVARISPFQKME